MKRAVAPLLLAASLAAGCHDRRESPAPPPSYAEIAPLLARACVRCHGASADGQVRLDDRVLVGGCTATGQVLVSPADEHAPLYAVLDREDHQGLLDQDERARLLAWLRAGAPGPLGSVHPAGILDPRSPEWHGALAARDQFAALRDPQAEAACGRCHDGSPARPPSVRTALPGAPACTSCHVAQGGVLACGTCHGQGEHAYPPRDRCLFPAGPAAGLHAEHVEALSVRATPLACSDCHPALPAEVLGGAHANGRVDVAFAATLAGADARFEADKRTCFVACHARGGALAAPRWDTPVALDCGSCHQTPPPNHYQDACGRCHREMGNLPTSLSPGPLHVDGKVELGLSVGDCGSCHGSAAGAWPEDAVHRAHRDTVVTAPIACDSCHVVPPAVMAPGHIDGQVTVRFSGRAIASGAPAQYDPSRRTCSAVACHGGALRNPGEAPRWAPTAALSCTACHGAPPPPPHVQRMTCEGALCHGGEVRGIAPALQIPEPQRARHIDGQLETGD